MRENAPSHISDKPSEFIKNIKMKECKNWPPFNLNLNSIEKIFRNI